MCKNGYYLDYNKEGAKNNGINNKETRRHK